MESNSKHRRPRLDRRNARKNFNYDVTSTSSSPRSSLEDPSSALRTRSLDLYPFPGRTSFRVYGEDGEMDEICRTLGLSGPEDFAIPVAAWEARKVRCSSDLLPRSRLHQPESPKGEEQAEDGERGVEDCLVPVFSDVVRVSDQKCELDDQNLARYKVCDESSKLESRLAGSHLCQNSTNVGAVADKCKLGIWSESSDLCQNSATQGSSSGVGGGIKGVRPPVLAPPPRMLLPVFDNSCSTWDIFRGFAPQDGEKGKASEEDDEVDGSSMRREEVNDVRFGETAVLSESCSFTTSNDDEDSSSTTTEPMYNISPDGRFRRSIKSWQKGDLLGSGSFGTVYEGITDDGFFFAVKEVSLLDQGSQGKQSIYQLEQEIALLSQFEHENIVQYLGTDKDDSKLYIFLEFVTKGSLANLYQKYHLRDSQVSVYTRQILCGLKYLHDRKVVHRDIKCANILVDASGSVKLADFGLAKATKLNDVKSCKGTAFWMAPEVVNGKSNGYGLTADIWSLGCTVLEMLTRQIPYSHLECMPALFKIGKGEPPPIPNNLSKDARNFISQCLQVNPDDRPTAVQLLGHPFVKRPLPTSMGSLSPQTNGRQS